MKYHSFRRTYTEDECYNKLDEPNNIIGKIENIFVLNTGYLYEDEEKKTYYIDTLFGKSPLIYVPEEKFSSNLRCDVDWDAWEKLSKIDGNFIFISINFVLFQPRHG